MGLPICLAVVALQFISRVFICRRMVRFVVVHSTTMELFGKQVPSVAFDTGSCVHCTIPSPPDRDIFTVPIPPSKAHSKPRESDSYTGVVVFHGDPKNDRSAKKKYMIIMRKEELNRKHISLIYYNTIY